MTAAVNFRSLYDTFHAALVTAQEQRDQRPDFVTVNGDPEPGWAVYERSVMLDKVNLIRAIASREPVDTAAVERAERMACGHFDYTAKFALYSAELALKETP